MADTEKGLQITFDDVTFEKEPEKFCKMIYEEALQRQEDLRPINVENREFYEGRDEMLEKRKDDPMVQRTAIFVNEIQPAIHTRVSSVVGKVAERPYVLTARPRRSDPTPKESAQARWIAQEVEQQLRDCGYLDDGYREHMLAAEIQRSPSTVKVDWEEYSENEAYPVEPSMMEQLGSYMRGNGTPGPRVEWRRVRKGRPKIEWLSPDEFLYEPNVDSLNHMAYCIHATYKRYHEVVALAKEFGWDESLIKSTWEKLRSDSATGDDESINDELEDSRGPGYDCGYQDDKILLAEIYLSTYNDAGEEDIMQIVFLGNEVVLSSKLSPYKGVRFPFVPMMVNRLPGTIEQMCSVDIGKSLARFNNEVYNTWIDAVNYAAFPPMKANAGLVFRGEPVWKLGAIWYMTDKDGIEPAVPPRTTMPDLTALVQVNSSRLRTILNAEDIAQGHNAQPYEKATSTRLRAQGAARRFMPTHKAYGRGLLDVAYMVLALNRQYATNAMEFILDVEFDIPSLTGYSDPDTDKQEALLLLEQMKQNPLYQSPFGLRKMRNQLEDTVRLFKERHKDISGYVPTVEELEQTIEQQRQAAINQQKQQAILTQMQLASASEPQGGVSESK